MNAHHTRRTTRARKLQVLEEITRGHRLSQRDLARRLNVSAAFLNRCIHELEQSGYVQVLDRRVRPFLYVVTADGERFRRGEIQSRYDAIITRFSRLERHVNVRLAKLKSVGACTVVCYGVGDLMDLVRRFAPGNGLEVIAAVDEDINKQRSLRNGVAIHAPDALEWLKPDAVIITDVRTNSSCITANSNSGSLIVWTL